MANNRLTEDDVAAENLYRIIGERWRQARILAGKDQRTAALELGYSNSSPLAKLELGYKDRGLTSLTLLQVVKAARLYGVSTDYLLGESDYYDNDPAALNDRLVAFSVADVWERHRERDIAALRWLHGEVSTLRKAVEQFAAMESELRQTFDRFAALNAEFPTGDDTPQGFDDLPGGARLVRCVRELEKAMVVARREMSGFDAKIRAGRKIDALQSEIENGVSAPPDAVTEIMTLADMPPLDYEQVRVPAARRLNMRAVILDKHVKIARKCRTVDLARQVLGSGEQLRMFEAVS